MKVNASAGGEKKNWERELLKICFDPQASPLQTATQHLEARTGFRGRSNCNMLKSVSW